MSRSQLIKEASSFDFKKSRNPKVITTFSNLNVLESTREDPKKNTIAPIIDPIKPIKPQNRITEIINATTKDPHKEKRKGKNIYEYDVKTEKEPSYGVGLLRDFFRMRRWLFVVIINIIAIIFLTITGFAIMTGIGETSKNFFQTQDSTSMKYNYLISLIVDYFIRNCRQLKELIDN